MITKGDCQEILSFIRNERQIEEAYLQSIRLAKRTAKGEVLEQLRDDEELTCEKIRIYDLIDEIVSERIKAMEVNG